MGKKSKPNLILRLGWVLAVVGLAVGTLAAVLLVISLKSAVDDAFFQRPCSTPCSETMHLDAKTYVVYQRVGSQSGGPGLSYTQEGPTTITPQDVSVAGPQGAVLPVEFADSNQTLNRNGAIYAGAVRFTVPRSADYQIQVTSNIGTAIVVAPDLASTFIHAVPGIGLGILAFLMFLAGVICIITGLVQRKKDPPAVDLSQLPPPDVTDLPPPP